MVLERYPSSTGDARATRPPRMSRGTHGGGAGIFRVALFFIVLCLAPRATRGQWQSPGESCSSDSDCYQGTMCAGGVCCTSYRSREGMANCTRCGSYSTEYSSSAVINCVECAAGTQLVPTHKYQHGRCDDICDYSLEYDSGMDGLQCAPKKNAGTSCSNDQQCLCLLYTSPSPRDATLSRMPSSA